MNRLLAILSISLFCSQASAQVQLMSPEKERALRSYVPKLSWPHAIDDKFVQAFLFTDAEIPPAYQVRLVDGSTAFFSTSVRPQGTPGPTAGIRWCYPDGAIVWDVLLKSFSDGTWACYTVRVREREIDDWDANSYVPFKTIDCLTELVGDNWKVTSRYSEELSKTFWVLELPPIPNARSLLRSRIFKPQSGEPFLTDGDRDIFAPTASDHDNVVPDNYLGSAIGADRESCRSCHRDTLAPVKVRAVKQSANSMEFLGEDDGVTRISKVKAIWLPPNPSGGVWPIVAWLGPLQPGYAYEEGSDGIRTFHPIEPSSIGPPAKRPKLRQSFLDAKIVEWHDPAKHPPSVYRQIKSYSNY